jgi:hypothetical protein
VIEPNIGQVGAASIEQEVQSARRRPVLTGILVLIFAAFAVWYMTGGSATGSPRQAEQLILTNTNPAYGNFTNGSLVQTVHCTQNGQSLIARIRGLFGGSTNGQPLHNEPATYYTCSGTSTTGQPMYWCVSFPPRNQPYNGPPAATTRDPNSTCPN